MTSGISVLFSIDNESVVALTTLLCCYNESFLVSHVMNSILNPNLPLVLNLLPNLSKLKVKLSRHKFGILQDKNVIVLSPRLITGEKFWGAVCFCVVYPIIHLSFLFNQM